MDSNKDIKITFLDSVKYGNTEKIRIFFKDIFSNDVQIDLRPGETVYSQTNHLSNSLKIYSKKGIISIEEKEKPEFLKYYIGYKEEEANNKYFLYNLKKSLEKPFKPEVPKTRAEDIVSSIQKSIKKEVATALSNDTATAVDKAMQEVSDYSLGELAGFKKKRPRGKKGPGRPKKRGPKKGTKRKKAEK